MGTCRSSELRAVELLDRLCDDLGGALYNVNISVSGKTTRVWWRYKEPADVTLNGTRCVRACSGWVVGMYLGRPCGETCGGAKRNGRGRMEWNSALCMRTCAARAAETRSSFPTTQN